MMSEKNIAEAKGSFLKRVAVDHEVNVFDRAVHGKINFSSVTLNPIADVCLSTGFAVRGDQNSQFEKDNKIVAAEYTINWFKKHLA